MRNDISLNLSAEEQYKFNVGIALELIKKVLYKDNDISSKELRNMISLANKNVKAVVKCN